MTEYTGSLHKMYFLMGVIIISLKSLLDYGEFDKVSSCKEPLWTTSQLFKCDWWFIDKSYNVLLSNRNTKQTNT